MRHELFASLEAMDHEIPEKHKKRYSLEDLIKLSKDAQKGHRRGK